MWSTFAAMPWLHADLANSQVGVQHLVGGHDGLHERLHSLHQRVAALHLRGDAALHLAALAVALRPLVHLVLLSLFALEVDVRIALVLGLELFEELLAEVQDH